MKIFADTASITQLRAVEHGGLIDGVTTNPSLIAKEAGPFLEVLAEICDLVKGPVSAEVAATDYPQIMAEGQRLAAVAQNVVVKLPLTWDGLRATRSFSEQGVKTNLTLCFTPVQALMAAKAGATFVSPFVGRLNDYGGSGLQLIADIRSIYKSYGLPTEILAASIRSAAHVHEAALAGADCVTMPLTVFGSLIKHPLTDQGLAQFLDDWTKSGQRIL